MSNEAVVVSVAVSAYADILMKLYGLQVVVRKQIYNANATAFAIK